MQKAAEAELMDLKRVCVYVCVCVCVWLCLLACYSVYNDIKLQTEYDNVIHNFVKLYLICSLGIRMTGSVRMGVYLYIYLCFCYVIFNAHLYWSHGLRLAFFFNRHWYGQSEGAATANGWASRHSQNAKQGCKMWYFYVSFLPSCISLSWFPLFFFLNSKNSRTHLLLKYSFAYACS